MNIIKVWLSHNEEYGYLYSNKETKSVNVFGLDGGRCTVMLRGQKKTAIDKQYTVWLNDLDFNADDLPEQAFYCHELGSLCKDKEDMDLVCEDYNSELDEPVAFKYA